MFSFLIVILIYLLSVLHQFIIDVINNNYKKLWQYIIEIIMLLIAIYLRSINL